MVDMDATEHKDRVINQDTIPEFDSYYPYLGTNTNGELKPPTEGGMKALFAKKKPKEGSSSVVRKLILGTFGVRSYDYFRTNYRLEDQLHIDPVSIFSAVVKKVKTYPGSLTLVNQGMQLPDQLMEQHET